MHADALSLFIGAGMLKLPFLCPGFLWRSLNADFKKKNLHVFTLYKWVSETCVGGPRATTSDSQLLQMARPSGMQRQRAANSPVSLKKNSQSFFFFE